MMKIAYLIPFFVLLGCVILNGFELSDINKSLAHAGILVLGITLFSGPLSKYSKIVYHIKSARRFLGISSFILLLAHSIISFQLFFNNDFSIIFNIENFYFFSIIFAIVSLLILLSLTFTSFNGAMKILGKNWKKLQNLGYVALLFGVIHFYLSQGAYLDFFQLLIILFLLIIILFRISMNILK